MRGIGAFAAIVGATLALPASANACTPMPSVYFFGGSSALDEHDREVLENFAARMAPRQHELVAIRVIGHSDRTGPRAARLATAARRAAAARDFLLLRGLSPRLLRVENAGDSAPAVETAEGVREPNNRRVELDVVFTPEALQAAAARREEAMRSGLPVPACFGL